MSKLFYGALGLSSIVALVGSCSGAGTTDSTNSSGGTAGAGGSESKCVVSTNVRTLLEETLGEDIYAGIDVAKKSEDKVRGFAVQIPGSDESFVGAAPVFSACPNDDMVTKCATTSDMPPTGAFWVAHDACVRTRCEPGGSNIALVDTFMTMQPKISATDKHEFTYDTTQPNGTASYDPNPLFTWRIDLSEPGAIKTTAKIIAIVRITETDGTFIDFSHTGSVSVERNEMDVSLATIDLTFESLLKNGAVLTASAQLDAAGGVSGQIMAGDTPIALVNDDFTFEWVGDCAP